MTEKAVLTNMPFDQLAQWITGQGTPAFRANQLLEWIYHSLVFDFQDMTNLPAGLRQKLAEVSVIQPLAPLEVTQSADGLTTKALLQLTDGETIETVLMHYEGRRTVCVSSQVGCAIGCPFCATGQSGFRRNLNSGEIVQQVLFYARQLKEQGIVLTNVVLMGMGEPLANYDATWAAIHILNDPRGLGLGARRFTISTAGLVPGIRRMAREHLEVNLAISLHAANDALRNQLVPVNRRYPLTELIPAVHDYVQHTGRRVSFEYALIEGINDDPMQGQELGHLLKGVLCHVNLIPMNPTAKSDMRPSSRARIMAFRRKLNDLGVANTVRLARGVEIQAGCGQLRSRHLGEQCPEKRV